MHDTARFRTRCQRRSLVIAGVLILLALGGCASPIPQAIREAPVNPLGPNQVQQHPDRYLGQRVRWGGTIIAVKNLPTITAIEVLARRLDADGEPYTQGEGESRFIAQIAGFLDPAEYEKDRLLTVAGILVGVETRSVGDYPYTYPLVKVDSRYLWPKPSAPPMYVPYGYPAWYGPWGPWYGPGYGPGYYGPRLAPYGPFRGPGWSHWRH